MYYNQPLELGGYVMNVEYSIEDYHLETIEYIDLGKLSFVVDIPEDLLSNEEIKDIAFKIKSDLEYLLLSTTLTSHVRVNKLGYRYGCLEIIVNLVWVMIGGMTIKSIKHFLIDYPKIREGVLTLARDIKLLKIKIKGETKKKGTFVRDNLKSKEQIMKEVDQYNNKQDPLNKI